MKKSLFDKRSLKKSIRRFSFGLGVGLFLSVIYWSYSAYFNVPLSLTHSIIATLFLAIACGVIATISSLDKLMDNFPLI